MLRFILAPPESETRNAKAQNESRCAHRFFGRQPGNVRIEIPQNAASSLNSVGKERESRSKRETSCVWREIFEKSDLTKNDTCPKAARDSDFEEQNNGTTYNCLVVTALLGACGLLIPVAA